MVPLSQLPAEARLKLLPMAPALDETDFALLTAALDKLFAQFQREERCQNWGLERCADGAILAIACDSELSGCSHDKIAHLLGVVGQRLGRSLLDAPPIVVQIDGAVRCLDRKAVRQLIATGAITSATAHWDLTPTTLGQWRQDGHSSVGRTWLRPWLDPSASRPVPA